MVASSSPPPPGLLFDYGPQYCSLICFQKDAMEDSVEIVIEKLLHVTKDVVPKVNSSTYSSVIICFIFGVSWLKCSVFRFQMKQATV